MCLSVRVSQKLFVVSPLLVYTFFRLMNDTEIAKAKRDFELKKAAYDVEVQTKVGHLSVKTTLDLIISALIRKRRLSLHTNYKQPRPSRE